MKYLLGACLVFILLGGIVKIATRAAKRPPELEKVPAYKVDGARWAEKLRWGRYLQDSVYSKAFDIKIRVLFKDLTYKQGYDSLCLLLDKTHTPFRTTN